MPEELQPILTNPEKFCRICGEPLRLGLVRHEGRPNRVTCGEKHSAELYSIQYNLKCIREMQTGLKFPRSMEC